jgi:hypothetical protein
LDLLNRSVAILEPRPSRGAMGRLLVIVVDPKSAKPERRDNGPDERRGSAKDPYER